MPTVEHLFEFKSWLAGVNDSTIRGAIVSRIKRLSDGNPSDVAPSRRYRLQQTLIEDASKKVLQKSLQ